MNKLKTLEKISIINLDELYVKMFEEQGKKDEYDEFDIPLVSICDIVLDVASGIEDIDEVETSMCLRMVLERAENEGWGSVEEFHAYVEGAFGI